MSKKRAAFITAIALSLSLSSNNATASIPFFSSNKNEIPTLAPMLAEVTPAVVSISVEGTQVTQQQLPEMFQHFFGNQGRQQQERPFKGLGSGVIIDSENGYIVTNAHVIDNATDIKVKLKDGRELEAKLLGEDPQSDVALLQVEAKDLKAVEIADSDNILVGDFVVAIGNPFGIGQTVTSGIVSALGRSGLSQGGYEHFIQTDAAINRGNSGGALINLKGQLVGINTAIIGPAGGNVGIGFAIPSNMMSNLVAQLKEHGEVRRGLLGITGDNVDAQLAKAMNLDATQGALVTQVTVDSAAERAGLQAGDVITALNGKAIQNFMELRAKIGSMGSGSTITITYERERKSKTIDVTLGDFQARNVEGDELHNGLAGANLSDGESEDGLRGASITQIARNSPAFASGLREGDVIVGVNRQRIETTMQLRRALENSRGVASLQLKRGETTLYLILR